MDFDLLASQLCISPLTLNNEIAKFKKELISFDLVFHTKNNQVWIEGNEKNKKKMISHIIYDSTKDFCCNMDAIQRYLPTSTCALSARSSTTVCGTITTLSMIFAADDAPDTGHTVGGSARFAGETFPGYLESSGDHSG